MYGTGRYTVMAQTLWETEALLQWQLMARWDDLVHLCCISNAKESHPITQRPNVGFHLREAELLPWLVTMSSSKHW